MKSISKISLIFLIILSSCATNDDIDLTNKGLINKTEIRAKNESSEDIFKALAKNNSNPTDLFSKSNPKSHKLLNFIKKLKINKNKVNDGRIEGGGNEYIEEFTEDEQTEILTISISTLNSYGVSNDIIISEFGSLENPEITRSALSIIRLDELSLAGYEVIELETGYNYMTTEYVGTNNLELIRIEYSGSDNSKIQVVDCALDALGIPAGMIAGSAKNLGTKAVLKAIGKLASRFLGWAGAAIGVYMFGACMGYW